MYWLRTLLNTFEIVTHIPFLVLRKQDRKYACMPVSSFCLEMYTIVSRKYMKGGDRFCKLADTSRRVGHGVVKMVFEEMWFENMTRIGSGRRLLWTRPRTRMSHRKRGIY